MRHHTALFQFPPETGQATVDEVLDHLKGVAAIPAIHAITVGPNLTPVTDGWAHGMTIVFDSFDAMMADFADHPLHKAVLRDQLPLFARYMAMDVGAVA